MQYYRPRGHNSKAGDCFPLFHDGTYHLFYLILRRNMHSKWDGGHGGLEIFHASTRDLVHWKHHPVAVPISEQWEAWNGTGNTVFHNGKFRMFYPTPDYDGHRGGIQLATSDDGEHFTKHPRHPFLPGGDCEVFADPDPQKKTVHLLKAGKTSGNGLPELSDKTLVAWVSPADLDQQGAGVLTVEGAGGQAGQFDSLVLGEAAPRRWMAGSDNFRRTQRDQRTTRKRRPSPASGCNWRPSMPATRSRSTGTAPVTPATKSRIRSISRRADGCWLVYDTLTGGTTPRPISAARLPTCGFTTRR